MTNFEREHLRGLARRTAEAAALPIMAQRRKWWTQLNDGVCSQPLVTFEYNGHWDDVYPKLVCETPAARQAEYEMVFRLFCHEYIGDDRVIDAQVRMAAGHWFQSFGRDVARTQAVDENGKETIGFADIYPVRDFADDFAEFTPSTWFVDEGLKATMAKVDEVREAVGDIIDVIPALPAPSYYPAYDILHLCGMETMLFALVDEPELFHQLIGRLTDEKMAFLDEMEQKGGLVLNNNGTWVGQGTCGYTSQLPRGNGPIALTDLWGYSNSQETVTVSPDMFDEFFFPYIKRFLERFGLSSFGCCEPIDVFWERSLSRINNLRKVSVSPWNNEEKVGEYLRGKGIVYHRKPFPNDVGVDAVFNEDKLRAQLTKSTIAARGCPLEITYRDVLSVQGEPWRMQRAVAIAREVFVEHYRT